MRYSLHGRLHKFRRFYWILRGIFRGKNRSNHPTPAAFRFKGRSHGGGHARARKQPFLDSGEKNPFESNPGFIILRLVLFVRVSVSIFVSISASPLSFSFNLSLFHSLTLSVYACLCISVSICLHVCSSAYVCLADCQSLSVFFCLCVSLHV